MWEVTSARDVKSGDVPQVGRAGQLWHQSWMCWAVGEFQWLWGCAFHLGEQILQGALHIQLEYRFLAWLWNWVDWAELFHRDEQKLRVATGLLWCSKLGAWHGGVASTGPCFWKMERFSGKWSKQAKYSHGWLLKQWGLQVNPAKALPEVFRLSLTVYKSSVAQNNELAPDSNLFSCNEALDPAATLMIPELMLPWNIWS